MRVFRVERSLGVLLLILLAGPVHAQTGAPTPLLPPGPANAPPSAVFAQPAAPGGGDDIQSEPLAPVAPVWGGTLGAADNALPRDMWRATPRSFVDTALPLLQPTTSPVLQDLARRLLLSNAIMPQGSDPANGPTLLDRRLDRVLALGVGDGAALIDALSQDSTSETLDRDAVELHITAGDLTGACKAVSDRVGRYRDQWWDQALVACQALTGAYDQASLGLSAMREQKNAHDPVFETLIDAILGHRAKLEKLPNPTPLRMALLAAAKLPAPADALATAGPAALAVWATSSKVPIADKLAAGEKAEAFGALPPAELGLLYSAVPFKPEEQSALLKSGKLPDDPRSRAILYDLARSSDPGGMRVAALAPLLADARRRGVLMPMARLVAPLVAELQPAPEWQSFAGDAARVLLATRAYDGATPWVELAGRPELRVIAGFASPAGEDGAPPPPLADAIAALTAPDREAARRQSDLLLSLAAALDVPVSGIDIANLLRATHQGMLPDGALWLDQQDAAKAQRVGETVLTTLLLATASYQLSPEPIVLAHAINGLKAVGLSDDARALAVEAALDAGI